MDIGTQMRLTGLATGLDTDEVIRNMGRIHTMKIDAVNRERQLAVWRQEIYRSTMSMLSGFQKSFLDVGSPANNFRSATAFAKFSFNLSLGGDAAAAAKIMSVTANADLKNFKQSVQAVAQLATKETLNGKEMGLQGIQSKGFDIENLADRTSMSQAEKDQLLNNAIDNALRDSDIGDEFDDWYDNNFDAWSKIEFGYDGLIPHTGDFSYWRQTAGFDAWIKEEYDFDTWRSANPDLDDEEAWNQFKSDEVPATARSDYNDAIYDSQFVEDLWEKFMNHIEVRAMDTAWKHFLDTEADPTDVQDIIDQETLKFGDWSQFDTLTFKYAYFSMSIDGVTRTIMLANDELEKIYNENTTSEDRTQAFADLVNEKIKNVFGKDF
ncbi:MAG: hypothetical protein LBB56_00715, partial [Chitinispirillales bacterium]|nr:hypothetical protein [Chitinispirillales bacterium]